MLIGPSRTHCNTIRTLVSDDGRADIAEFHSLVVTAAEGGHSARHCEGST